MILKISKIIIVLTLFSSCSAEKVGYHKTNTLLTHIKLKCAQVPQLSCHTKDGILVVDWNKNVADKSSVLLVFNEHARERITAELALHVINKLTTWKPKTRVTLIPVLNVWGRKKVEAGNPCVRKNENGVDTNRNYQMMGVNNHRYPKGSEEYQGPHPISEKESKLVSSLLLNGVKRYVNVHSGEKSLYMPYDSRTQKKPPKYKIMEKNIKLWSQFCRECAVGAAAKKSFYKAFGTSVDFAVDRAGVDEAYTFEIYGDAQSDCERMFNPSKRDLKNVLNQWGEILKRVMNGI